MNEFQYWANDAEEADIDMDRRRFLKTTGTGIFLFFTLRDVPFFTQEGPGRAVQQNTPSDFNAYLRIGEDGRVACYTGKIEMGQGIVTSLAQMLADEMDLHIDNVDMVMGDTDLCPFDRGTFGSLSTRAFGPSLRTAGAEARRVLIEMASEQLKVPVSALATEGGAVFDRTNPAARVTYGALAKGKKIDRNLRDPVVVKKPSEFKLMSKPLTRRDAREKVTGKALYAGDIRLPGMLYAKILRPPAHGAKLLDVDTGEAGNVEGARVIRDGDMVAVLHKYPDVAQTALGKIKAKFDTGAASPFSEVDDRSIYDHLLKVAPAGKVVTSGGDLAAGEKASASVLEETYYNAYVAHAPMEPHTAVVRIDGNKATVWASTQAPFGAREEVARELGFKTADVRVITPFVGGGFGGKTAHRQVVEAARLAKLSGSPVQVAWTRSEEFFYDSFRPAAVVKIRSGINGKGTVSFWDYGVYFAGERGAPHFYDFPNHRTTAFNSGWVGPEGTHPFATGAWRAPGNNTNSFARESQIDIMAAQAGIDPVEFRLRHISDPKMKRALETAAEKFGWKPAKSPSGRGFGVALGIDAGTSVASMAEVSVNKSTGDITVRRVLAVQDMGLVVNPEGAAIQMEGCIMMGLGYALREGLHFKGGEISDRNFGTYEIPRFSWLPTIETHILDDENSPPQGGGEPAIVTMGAVIANAVYDAVGARLFELPMIPGRVREAIRKG
jgi:isoquinoline 1-oxidoreductase